MPIAQVRRANIRVCTYNVKNLFLSGDSTAKPAGELRALVRMIDQVDADFLGLQEVGSEAALRELNSRLGRPYPYLGYSAGNSTRGIGLGLLSRRRFKMTSHARDLLCDPHEAPLYQYLNEQDAAADRRQPLRFQRDALLAELSVAERYVGIFVAHLKSRTNRPWQLLGADEIRAAEARRLAQLVSARKARGAVLVMGDLNDLWSSDALEPLRAAGMTDPIGQVLRNAGRNPSTYWPKRRMRLDHIVLSEAAGLQASNPVIHANRMAQTASDHYPVSIEVNWRES